MAKQNMADRAQMMLRTPMPKLIASMAFPSIIAFLINSIYSLADTYFVSSLGNSRLQKHRQKNQQSRSRITGGAVNAA